MAPSLQQKLFVEFVGTALLCFTVSCLPKVPRRRPRERLPSTDWRNGSASDSSPEGYVFESRIGHLFDVDGVAEA